MSAKPILPGPGPIEPLPVDAAASSEKEKAQAVKSESSVIFPSPRAVS
jgi:hypothetical protein